ncbi:MAG: hypothetical protein AAFV88_05250 [Planctomycetota bacterium]
MEQVLKMVEGGQVVPALDRLRTILEEHPDAAWAFAIRGRLLISLQEFDSLAENADRFIRLQPSNPLSLAQRAAALVFRGEVQEATDSLLEALNESGLEVDAFLMDIAMLVASGLVQQGVVLSARTYAMLTMGTQGYEESYRANQFLGELDRSPRVNHLLKQIPRLIERPADADWGERYDEASALLRSNKVLSAQDKLESLRRTAPMQPAVLSGLLHCAIWRGDIERQADMAKQLSEIESLDSLVRQRYRALAAVLSPEKSIGVEGITLHCEVDEIEQAEMALMASERATQIGSDRIQELRLPGIEIPPRSAFFLLNEPKDSDQTVHSIALVCLFGKQTDRNAELIALDITADRMDTVKSLLAAIAPGGKVTEDEPQLVPMTMAITDQLYRAEQPKSISIMVRENRDFEANHTGKRMCELAIPLLGGKSLSEAGKDETLEFEREVIVRMLECEERVVGYAESMETIYKAANVEPLPPLRLKAVQEAFEPADLSRIDPSELDAKGIISLATLARGIGCTRACERLANFALEKTENAGDDPQAAELRSHAFVFLIGCTPLPEDSLKICAQALEHAKANSLDFSGILIAQLELHLAQADQQGFTETIREIETNYGSDPNVMARVQSLLVSLGVLRPDGSMRRPSGAPAAAPDEFTPAAPPEQRGEGLWTPDNPSPSAPAEDSGNKLWVPGMD